MGIAPGVAPQPASASASSAPISSNPTLLVHRPVLFIRSNIPFPFPAAFRSETRRLPPDEARFPSRPRRSKRLHRQTTAPFSGKFQEVYSICSIPQAGGFVNCSSYIFSHFVYLFRENSESKRKRRQRGTAAAVFPCSDKAEARRRRRKTSGPIQARPLPP